MGSACVTLGLGCLLWWCVLRSNPAQRTGHAGCLTPLCCSCWPLSARSAPCRWVFILAYLLTAADACLPLPVWKRSTGGHSCRLLKGEVYPEMKLCELFVLVHCIHLPLILFACASSGQSYNIDSPVVPNCCDVIDTVMTRDPIAF